MTFRADERGLEALDWWRERCIEWCFAHHEDGRMGDQKYLDDWTQRFRGVRNLAHPGVLGPWNIESRRVEHGPDGITVDGEPLVFFHFMGLRTFTDGSSRAAAGRFRISAEQRRAIYDPYIATLRRFEHEVAAIDSRFKASLQPAESLRWRVQAPISACIGALTRTRVRLAPHFNVGPYLPGGYVPHGYQADPDAIARVRPAVPEVIGEDLLPVASMGVPDTAGPS